MASISVSLRNLPDTEAAVGWAGGHTVVIDRPEGRAGGMNLGFNGGQMIALAIGGCFCNDLRYVAHEMGVDIAAIAVNVTVALDGDPLLVTGAEMEVHIEAAAQPADIEALIERAERTSTISNSVRGGFPVTLRRA